MRIAYRRAGSGPAVLLIHGVGGDAGNWGPIAHRLRRHFDVIAMDLRGHGGSDLISGPIDVHDLARDAVQVLDECNVARCAVVGMSLGGAVAQALALDFPQRVEKLATIVTVCGRTDEETARAKERLAFLEREGAAGIAEANRTRWFTDAFIARHPELVEQRVAQVKACDAASYRHAFRVFATTDLVDRLHEIRVPTLVITGEHDVAATPRMAELMAERIANAQAHVLRGLKHSLLIEAPEAIGNLLEPFLKHGMRPDGSRADASVPSNAH
jgi:3-oxoadipate enol-lactonase